LAALVDERLLALFFAALALRPALALFGAAILLRLDFAVGRLEVLRLPARDPDLARDFFAFEAIGVLRGANVEEESEADTAKTGLSGSALLGPSAFL
jgi:hypothetical protein